MQKTTTISTIGIVVLMISTITAGVLQGQQLVFTPPSAGDNAKHIVLVAGDQEYRTEESMPMLAKILSVRHGFKCTVVFSYSEDGSYIDPNNERGLKGLSALDSADLMLIGTRFRRPSATEAAHITKFLNDGKPVIGIRTATHAFTGQGNFGDKISYGQFGLKVLGETWVSHHGGHKRQGARGHIQKEFASHPVMRGVGDVFAPSDVYGVKHLTDADQILMRAAVTESLDPASKDIDGAKNDPMQPFVWIHTYEASNGKKGRAICTTGGASLDLVNEGLRRTLINAAYYLTDQEVPKKANVDMVDAFYPSFYGFIRKADYWKNANLQPADFGLGKSPAMPDPAGSPPWPFRPIKGD
jgi:hypothetical protein